MEFKVGDKVRAYGYSCAGILFDGGGCTVDEIEPEQNIVRISTATERTDYFHKKQLRKIKIKPRREMWLIEDKGFGTYQEAYDYAVDCNIEYDRIIHFKEVREKK